MMATTVASLVLALVVIAALGVLGVVVRTVQDVLRNRAQPLVYRLGEPDRWAQDVDGERPADRRVEPAGFDLISSPLTWLGALFLLSVVLR